MLILTRLDGKTIAINEIHIEHISETPDTIITLTNGHSFIVKESIESICDKIISFNRDIRKRGRAQNRTV